MQVCDELRSVTHNNPLTSLRLGLAANGIARFHHWPDDERQVGRQAPDDERLARAMRYRRRRRDRSFDHREAIARTRGFSAATSSASMGCSWIWSCPEDIRYGAGNAGRTPAGSDRPGTKKTLLCYRSAAPFSKMDTPRVFSRRQQGAGGNPGGRSAILSQALTRTRRVPTNGRRVSPVKFHWLACLSD